MLSINTLPATIAQFTSGLSIGNVAIKRQDYSASKGDVELDSAYAKFANHYSSWVDSHFDKQFLANGGADTLAEYTRGQINRHEAAVRLAEAWDKQMGPARSVVRKRRVADATMVADHLLGWYEVERRMVTGVQ